MRVLAFLIIFIWSTVFALTPSQAQGCYTSDEATAERLLRIHSELLVIGLNCQHRADLGYPYQDYQAFTTKNAALIAQQENVMLRFFMSEGRSHPQKAFHEYRTGLANVVAKDAAMRPDGFCATYGNRVRFARGLSRQDLMQWASKYPVSRSICGL